MGAGIETLLSRHNSMGLHKQAIERQLALIVTQIHEQGVILIPRTVFLLVEMRGCGGLSKQLEQIAHVLREEGYWKPRERVQNYHPQDVYQLGKSAQKLCDDYATLDRRVEQLNARLEHIKAYWRMEAELCPQEVLQRLAATANIALIQHEVAAIIDLLEQANRPGWFRRLFVHRGRRKALEAFRQ